MRKMEYGIEIASDVMGFHDVLIFTDQSTAEAVEHALSDASRSFCVVERCFSIADDLIIGITPQNGSDGSKMLYEGDIPILNDAPILVEF